MNWKLRLQNPATCGSLILVVITFVYTVLAILGITPGIGEGQLLNFVAAIFEIVFGVAICVDPTTQGILDSIRAKNYDVPYKEPEFGCAADLDLLEPADRSDNAPEAKEE